MNKAITVSAAVVGLSASVALAQSSSLFVPQQQTPPAAPAATPGVAAAADRALTSGSAPAAPAPGPSPAPTAGAPRGPENTLLPAIAQVSFSAVRTPEPKKFAVQDLVTIVIRESTEADSSATLDAKKDTNLDAEVTDFPNLNPANLVKLMIGGSALTNPPKVSGKTSGEFKGDGSYTRKDTFTSRITARIIDVKPNGVLVLEASKDIKSDKETLKMTLTGACRREDVATDNTVLSTQIYDLRLNKEHSGEVNGAIKKGIITQFFDLLFNF